jgi:hypothetical protein
MPTLDDLSILPKLSSLSANDLVPVADASGSYSGASKVKALPAALVAQGFTHAWVINYNNAELVAQTTNDTDEVITLMAIPANSVIDKARLVITTAFTGLTAVNAFVGRTGDADGYIASKSLLSKDVVENTGAEIDTVNEIDVVTASDQNLLITFDPAANSQALDELTAGQVVVLVSLTQIADYANLVPAT